MAANMALKGETLAEATGMGVEGGLIAAVTVEHSRETNIITETVPVDSIEQLQTFVD
jgi:hypothetical protein